MLELTIEMHAGTQPVEVTSQSNVFDMGGNVSLSLSNAIRVDGTWTTMPEGFPTLVTEDSTQVSAQPPRQCELPDA
jgi:hypothetical protein